MSTKTIRCALYCRISKSRDGESVGVERQERECRALAEANGWTVSETYIDNDVSAYDSRRRRVQFERMMADARDIDVVVVWAADRLYRRVSELERIVDTLNAASVRVATVKSGEIDLATADGRAVARILGSLGQRESEKIAERVSAAALDRARRGRSTTGRRPFGWNFDGTVNEPEAAALRDAFRMLLEGASVSGIARELDRRGMTSTEGGPIRQGKVSAWLRNPRNAGIVTYKGQRVAEAAGIIDRPTWDAAQALLADPSRAPKKGRPHSTLLGGLLSCGVCGQALKPSSNSVNGGRRIATYGCEPHRHVNRSRADLDLFMTEALAGYVSLNAGAIEARMERPDGTLPLIAERDRLAGQVASLASLLAAGSLDVAAYAAAVDAVAKRREEVEAALVQEAGMTATASVMTSGDAAGAVRGLDRERFRALFRELVASATVPRGGGLPVIVWAA